MRAAAAIAIAVMALAASLAPSVAAEVEPGGMVMAPAGLYRPFLKVKALNDSEPSTESVRGVDTFRAAGGNELRVAPCVNADDAWAAGVVTLARESWT